MRLMGLVRSTIARIPAPAIPAAAAVHNVYPYLLAGYDRAGRSGLLALSHPRFAGAALHPDGQGFLDLVVIMIGKPRRAGLRAVDYPLRRFLCRGAQ